MEWIYLDNNATTRPPPEVRAAMAEVHESLWANPSSVHRFGQMARQRVELARASVARLIGARPRQVLFTSGGTESNNLALRGALGSAGRDVLITTRIEHSAVREPCELLAERGATARHLPLDADGRVTPDALSDALDALETDERGLVSIQSANNETGVIQPMAQLAESCRRHREKGGRVLLHTDATQAVGKMPVDVGHAGVDMLTCSAHKFHGPKGVGALYVRRGLRLYVQNAGGTQEREMRGGTENVAGIVGAGVAADHAASFLAAPEGVERGRRQRDAFEQAIGAAVTDAVVHARQADRIWNTTNIGFPRLEAEAILLALSERGICASAGAACSSGSLEPSPVLLALGIPEPLAHGSVRFSLSRFTTDEEIEAASRIVPEVVQKVRGSF